VKNAVLLLPSVVIAAIGFVTRHLCEECGVIAAIGFVTLLLRTALSGTKHDTPL